MAKKNNELPVNPETGTAATRILKLDPVAGTTESGFQEHSKKNNILKLDKPDTPAIDTSSSVTNLDWSKYEGYINQAFIPEGGIEELNKARARNQSTWEQLGNKSVQVVTGIGLGIAENAGYLFDIEAHIDTMTGVGNDYSNFLTDLAQRGKEAINDNFTVYRENPNQTFDLGDPAWWINHGGDLIESIGEFAVTGAGIGKVLGSGAKGLAMLFKNAKGGAKIAGALNTMATTGTAMELAYIEGAMGGKDVYINTYDKAREQGMSHEEANNKASQAAATTVQLNTLINTGLNFTSAKMFTRPMSAAGRLESKFARQAGETLDAWKARLKEEVKQPGVLAGIGGEMTQEALEEVVNEVATALGERKGSELTGLLTDEEKRGGRLGTIIETLGKEETALAAILGAVGGGGQTLVTSALPSSRRAKQAEADYQRRQLDYVVDRITAFESAQVKMSDALKNKDAKAYEDAVNEAFNTQAISSVISGTQEQVSGIYNEISNLSKEEAEAAGYDIDPASPEYYKKRAANAVEDIKKLSIDYENIINKYNAYDNDAAEAGYGEEVFIRHAKKYNVERAIDRAQMRLDKSKAEHQKQLERRGTPMGVNEAVDISNNIKAIDKAVEQTALEINEISKLDARSNASRRDVERRYGIPPKGTSRKQHAFNMIKERVDRMNKQRENLYNALNKAKEDFIEAGNKAEDFRDALDATTIEQNDIQNFQAAIINARETLKQADAEFKKFTSQEGRDEFVKLKQDDNAKRRAEEEANAKKAENDKKAEEEAAKRKAASQKARDKKRSQETEVATEPVETPMATEPTVETSPVVEPEVQDEQEVNREIVGEGILASEETAPQPALEDGDVQNPTEKKKGSAYKTETSKSTSDFLVVPAANSFAYLSKKYKEEGGKKVTETSDKNENLIKELESSVEFQPGDKITLEIDRTATWQDKDGKTWSYDDFVNEDGSVDVANVPIAIKKDGKTVAFVRTQNWILQKDESNNYANVADNIDPEHPMFGNAEYQAKLNLALRNSILKRGSVETTITNKSIGNLSMNLVNGKPTKGKMSELTPKVKTFTIVKNGQFHTNAVDQYSERDLANSKEFLESLNDWNGLVFAELVTPNGSALMIPVSIPNLSEQQAETIYNGLVASFNKTENIRSQVFGETDLDLFTDSGVLEFLKLFTHTTDESDANFKEKVDGEGKDNARHLNYSTKTGKLSYARHNRGVVIISSLEELEANKADFMAFLGEKLFSVRLSSINSTEAVSEPVINNDGTVSSNHYSSYNDYIKTSLETDVKGSEINENEESYFDQPVIEFSQDLGVPPMEKTDEVAEPITPVEPITQSTQESDIETKKADIERNKELAFVNSLPIEQNISLSELQKLGLLSSSLFGQSLYSTILSFSKNFDIKIRFTNGVAELDSRAGGSFSSQTGVILINLNALYESYQNTLSGKGRAGGTMLGVKNIKSFEEFIQYTVTHELIHGLTQSAYNDVYTNTRRGKYNGSLNQTQVEAVQAIAGIYNYLKTLNSNEYFGGVEYGLANMSELMAEMSNEGFVSALQRIELPQDLRYSPKNKNVFESIISFITDLFKGKKVENNTADSLFAAISDIITSPQTQTFSEIEYTQNSTTTVQDKINAKYDAELAELNKPTQPSNKADEIKADIERLEKEKQDLLNQPSQESEVKEVTPSKVDTYLSVPNQDGSFNSSSSRMSFIPGASIMAFESIGNNKFAVYISKNDAAVKLALQYPDRTIDPVFEGASYFNPKAKEIQVIKPAIVELQGDKYVLVEKGLIDYDNVGINKSKKTKTKPDTSKIDAQISQKQVELKALESKQEVVEGAKLSTNVKEGVTELFESNPELANAVYEALGFTAKSEKALLNIDERVKKEVSILNKLLALTKKGNFNEAWDKLFDLVIDAEKNKTNEEYIALIEFQKEVDKYFGYLINTINDKSVKDTAISDEIKNIKEEAEKDKLKKRRVTSEEKQQAQQLYSQYIEQTGKQDIEGFKEFASKQQSENKSEPEVDTTNLDLLNDIDELMGIDDSIGYERSSKPVNDFEMTDLQKEFLKKGLEAYLVVDKDTNVPYNAYKQSQVVDSIVELAAKSMQSGSNREQAFEQAKQVFMKRQQLYATAEANFDKLTDEQKRKLAITNITDAQELSDEFKRVNRNWEAFSKRATQKLASIFGIKKTINDIADSKEVEDALDGYEELESQLDKVSFDDGATFQTNHKDTASARLKLFLALQESPNRTFLNLKSFIPFDTVFDELQMMLAGTEPNYDLFIQHLYLVGTDKPYVKNLITKLESSDQQIRNEFVVAFSKQHNTFSNVLWSMKPVYKNGKIVSYSLQMQPVDSNRNDVVKKIESQWIENQKSSPIVKVKGGELMINPEVAKQFASIVDELAVKPDIEKTRDLLKMIGIDMPIKALKDLEQNSVKKTGQSFVQHFKTGMFKHMAKALNKNHSEEESSEVESLLELNNPLTGVDREGSSIKVLASLAAAYSEAIHSNSFRDTEGKTIYSYSLNSALSHKMRELTSNDGNNATLSGLAKISFSKYSHWGEQLRTNGAFRESFGLYYMDGLSKRGSKQKGVKRKDQSEKELELQAIGLFQNQGRNTGFFIYPTISDKTTTPLIQALKHDVKVLFNADGTYTFGKATKKIIHDLVRSEIDRIENYKPGKDTIKGYDTGGATKFFLFPGLNEILGDERLSDGKIPVDIQTKLFAAAENHIKELVNNTVKAWEDLGIKTDESLMLDASYVNTVAKPKTQNGSLDAIALYAAIDMEVNYMISNANVMQLMSGDPALHYKKDVETTMVEYTKRLAKDIAPGLDGNWSKPKYRTVFLKDKDTVSQHLEEYRKIIGEKSKSYTGIEGTDAQEYTTLAEHLNVMNAYGKLSAEDYIKFKRKAREGKPFSGKELDIILQPMKPVYVGNEFDFERDVNKVTYIKSSSFPLIPQFTKGLEIDALRKEMEKHKIDRAAYVTATKLGSTKATQIWDGNVMAEGFSLEGKAVVLDRKGFRIQQEVPYKEDKVKILTVSQMNKLLFEGILGIKGMSELKARKEAIRIELFEKGKKELLKELGAIEVNGEYVFKDLKKVKDILIKEAIDRNYPINDIQALELSEDGKSFKIPLGFNASSKKFESVLMSLITNRILKQKIAGKSYIQASSAGVLTGANKSKKWSELTDKELGGITFTANANLDNGLKFVRKEDGEVKGAQLLVPFYFRDSNGKPLKISDYTKVVDGKTIIDPDKIDSELLRLVGARIPNQGHSSMLPIEIVGFLPESMGDLVIVPDEITKQMGSDFDVDKLYTYQYEYTIGANGKLAKIPSTIEEVKAAGLAAGMTEKDIEEKGYLDKSEVSLKNEYVDIHWKVLTHPEVLPRILAPLDQKGEYSVAGEAELIHGIRSKNAKQESFLYRRGQQIAFIQNRGGKAGVGIFSLASTFNATIQDKDLSLKFNTPEGPTPRHIKVFEGYSLSKLSGKGTNSIADKATIISDMQSAAVDNAKEQTLDKLNLNSATFGAAIAMAQLEDDNGKNLTIQHISRLLSQKVILDYVKELEKLSDSTSDTFVSDKSAEAIARVKEKYSKNATGTSMTKLNPENMLKMIENESAPNGEWYSQQLLVLEAFEEFNEVGTALTNIQSAINSDSKGVDPTFFQVTEKINRISNVVSNPLISGTNSLVSMTTEVGAATQLGPVLAMDLMGQFLPQGSDSVNSIFNELMNITGKDKLHADLKQRIFDEYKSFIFTNNGWFANNVNEARADLLIDNETPSLATRVAEAQKTWGKDNFLLKRLMPKFSTTKGDPARVEYVASAGERLDEQESTRAFVDMLSSNDPVQAKLGRDLVTYAYLTSGNQNATNFMKFIPNIYLLAMKIDNKFEEFNWNDDSKSISFITQLIQNNPDLATTMPEKVSELVKNDKFALPDLASESNEFSNLIYPVVENGETKLTYPKFFKVRENKEYKLYMNVGQDPNGSGKHMYERINTLGGEGNISEYSFNSPMLSRSIYQKNNVSVEDSMLSTGVPNTSVSASVDNPNANTSILAEYNLTPETEFEDFMNSIKKISKESANPAHRVLAKILYAAKVQLDPFTFKVNNTMSSFGRFSTKFDNGNKVRLLEINTNNHSTDKGFDSNSFEATLLHELGHGYTSQIIDAYFKDESKLPENMKKAVKSLNAIRQKLFNSLSEEEQQEATKFAALSPEEKKSSRLPRATKMQYYALTNTKEFFTATLTDESFQEYLNSIPFEGEKSLLDRFLEVLSKLYKAIAENLGVEVKSDSALEYAIHESVNLIQHSGNIDSTMSAEDSMIIGDIEYVSYPVAVSLFEEFGLFTQRGEPRQYLKNTKGEAEINAKIKEMNNIKSPFMQKYGRYYRVTKRIHKTTEPGGKQREFYILAFRKANKVDLSTYYSSDESIGFGKDPESTLSPSMEKLIARLDSRIRELSRAMSESKLNKVEYQEKIDVLEKQKELIIEENNLKAMQDVAKTHLDWASNILDHKSVSTSELKEVEHIINVWGDVKSLFKEDYQSGGKYQEVLSQISNRAEDLNTKLLDISKQVILTEINSDSARQVKMRDLEVMKDITSTRANMLDLSHVDHPVIQSLDTWLKNAARDTNYEFTLFAKDAKTVFEKLKQHPEFKKNGYDIYLQKDKNGEWTGGLTHRYSQDWYDFRISISKKRDRKKDNPEAWKRYFEELKKNEVIVDSRVLFDKDGNRKSDGVAKKHIKELEAEFGQVRAEEMITQAEEKYMEYLTHLAAFELSVETERDVNPEMTEEQAKDKIARWKQENSPFTYIDSYKGNLIIRGLKMRGYRYTVAKPRKMIDGKPTKWYDKNYEKIENDPVLKEFYDFYRSAMAKNMSVLPTYALKDTKNNFIPYIKKQLMERYTDSGMKGAVSGLYENFVDSISSVESSIVSADRNIRTGNVNKRIPIKFLQEASVEDKSKDLMKGLEMFTLMALNYKHKSKVEDKVLITQRLINEAAQQQVTANNEVQRDSEGNLYETKDGNVNLKKLVQHTIDYSLYDKRRNEGDPTGIFVTKNPKDSIKATKIAKQISALNRKHSLGQITDEEHTEQVAPLQKELDELGGRNISTADIADFTMKVTQLKGMAINIFSASNNMTFGLLSNIVHAAGGEDFTMKEAMKAYRMMLNSTSKSLGLDRAGVGTSTAKKINALVEKFDILFEVNESAYRGSNKSKSKLTPYELQKRGEYFVQGMNMVARMLNEKVMTKDGKETSLFEAFDENGNWRTDVYGENSQWSGDINDDTQMKDFRKFRNRLIQLNKRIHGNYDPNSFPMIKKSVLGRFASQFRSWIAESVAARFDYEQWDDQLGRNTKGTYRTIAQLGPMATIKYFVKIALARKNGLSDLSDVDRANLKKAFVEVSAIIALNIMALSVMALADDDDDDKAVRTALINHLKRVEADFTFYTSPSSFDQILSNPIPAIRTYMDAEKALKHTSQYIMQDEELDGRKKLESEDVIEKWLKAFPFLNQLPKAKYQTEKIF